MSTTNWQRSLHERAHNADKLIHTASPAPRHKYNASKTNIDGITFASKKEASRYCELKLLLQAGEITDLELQPSFDITVNGQHVARYIADFRYRDRAGQVTIEDAKGFRTPVYRLKRKLVEALYGISITEV